jgi:radical SAM protein with 4Fe4S-binding SPASM domain
VKNSYWPDAYLRLHPQAAIKKLELPYIYHAVKDELYEIDESTLDFLTRCDGSSRGAELTTDGPFVTFCLSEGILEALDQPALLPLPIGVAPVPSLRYLELQLTRRCNLRCRHCYLAEMRSEDLPLEDALAIIRQFSSHGGLRLLISGGEPLLYPYLKDFIAETDNMQLRRVLLTNGTLITDQNASWLHVEEIQFSLDGWLHGHDLIRGPGSFDLTMRGIQASRLSGIPISIATMIHSGNVNEFKEIQRFTNEIQATEWGVDIPCVTGALDRNRDLIVPYKEAIQYLEYAYGGGYHGSSDGYACGRHLMTVTPSGSAVKCGFYDDAPLGDARQDLISCWLHLRHTPLDALDCKSCAVVEECRGGCRFRAPHPLAPDPAMCALYRIE